MSRVLTFRWGKLDMSWSVHEESSHRLVSLDIACLDTSIADRFCLEIQQLLNEDLPVVLDMSKVQFADTSGLGAICTLARKAKPGVLYMGSVSGRMEKILARVASENLPKRWKMHESPKIAPLSKG